MRQFALFLIMTAALLAGCGVQQTVPVEPLPLPTSAGEVVVTMVPQPEQPQATENPQVEQPAPVEPQPSEPAAAPQEPAWIAYTGDDGNIWMVNPGSGEMRQVTEDGTPMNSVWDGDIVSYDPPQWSSDGQMIAALRQHGKPVESGYEFTFSVLVYDLQSQTSRTLLEGQQMLGAAWRPGTRQIAYGQYLNTAYFATRGQPDPTYARGIWTVDVDSGETAELVKPERGLALARPSFSPDGRYVAFQEIYMMEGAGKFGYYDLQEQQYHSWDKPIGPLSWSPDSQRIAYAYLTYMPSGEESIYTNTIQGDAEKRLLPENAPDSYAFGPVFSPDGSQIAYIQELIADRLPEGAQPNSQVMVMPVEGGEPRSLGIFDQPGELEWSADGQNLLLGIGPHYAGRQVALLSVSSGTLKPLTNGVFASWQPLP